MLSLPEGPRSPCAGLLPSGVPRQNTAPPCPSDDGSDARGSDRCDQDPSRPQSCAAVPRAIAVLKDGTDWEPATIALYVEVIQTIPERQSVWVRPLVLCDRSTGNPVPYDVRTEADLIWPSERVQWAEDVEVLPWLAMLAQSQMPDPAMPDRKPTICQGMVRSQFQAWVRRLWQAHRPSASA